MPCYLLTGATGLLGTYLVRDLLQAGHELAVVVRETRIQSAQARVDRLLTHRRQQGVELPRPTVFAGDITQTDLGLSSDAQNWVATHVDGIVHSAASLKFREHRGEPWTTNLNGTENVVRFAERLGREEFHYISTAYVCGKTSDVAYELPVPVGVEPRNVYEASKAQAERRVQEADLPQPATILRPSIIIGDSATGYTTTFHGVYLPLRQAVALMLGMGTAGGTPAAVNPSQVLRLMGLSGQETKNLVPVDWVSRMITRVVSQPEHHGSILHLASSEPASVELVTRTTVECILQAVGISSDEFHLDDDATRQTDDAFCSLLSVYREYWADDPRFDTTGIQLVAPDDVCPQVTEEMLLRTFRYALDEMVKRPNIVAETADA